MTAGLGLGLMAGVIGLFGFHPELVAQAAARSVGSSDPAVVADAIALLPLAGLALAAAVPAHLVGAVLRARGQALAALSIFAVGHGGVGLCTMIALGLAGFGPAGIWSGLLLGATICSGYGLGHLGRRGPGCSGLVAS